MKKAAIILIVILQGNFGFSQAKNFLDKSYLETKSYIDTLVIPDRIYLSIELSEKDTKDKISVEELEVKMSKKLKELNIDTESQLSLSDVSSNFKQYFLKKKDVMKNKHYTLLVYDAQTAGKIMVALESVNISNVNLEKIAYSRIEEMKMYLRKKAVEKAKLQAAMMVESIDQKIGRAIHISDLNSSVYRAHMGKSKGLNVTGNEFEKEGLNVEFEKIKVDASVAVKFEID